MHERGSGSADMNGRDLGRRTTMAQTILLTDGHPTARRILKRLLAPLGADIHEAEQAEDALKLLRLLPIDLVIADVDVPGMGAVSFVAATREHPGAVRKVPIILLTSSHRPGLEEAALRAGASAFLPKPVDSGQIVAAASRLLGRRAERAAAAAV
jgi:two-component system chemotaxis response regulator CheY